MIYAKRCLGLKMPGQTVAPLFSLTPYRQPLNRRQSTSASFSSEILSAFGDKTNAVLDLTFGDGHHSRLLLGIDFFYIPTCKGQSHIILSEAYTVFLRDIDGHRICYALYFFSIFYS
jgi:hypothetical protein